MMEDITYRDPQLLWLLLLLVPVVAYYIWKNRSMRATVVYSDVSLLSGVRDRLREKLVHLPFVLRTMAIALVIVAVARPQSSSSWQDVSTEGIDIVISMDISGSMLAEDFKPNRLEASKKVAKKFISKRPNDRLGLVVFAGESFTQCPLTTDHSVVLNLFDGVESGMLKDGTAIGMGLATSVKRLKDSEAISKVVILLTDGENNAGNIGPATAAEIAQEFGVRVYTIGVGSRGTAPVPYVDAFGRTIYRDLDVNINEDLLTRIADMTGGRYFRATDNESLQTVYDEIDEMERSKIEVTEYRKRKEEFLPFALAALLLVIGEIIVRQTLLRTVV